MENQSPIANRQLQILVVGAGPAGSSLAIRLSGAGFEVVLIERERFPREKLCGEFVSPECLAHFAELGVLEEMLASGGERIFETRFYAASGKSFGVPSRWFGAEEENALGISRAEMDLRLLEKARETGVRVLEETSATALLFDGEKICGVTAKNRIGEALEIRADVTVDATGRANVLGKLAEKDKLRRPNDESRNKSRNPESKTRNRLVGFKAHLRNARIEKGLCEIYSFPGGYGGLSRVENDLANHCFLIRAETVRTYNSDVEQILEKIVFQNIRAAETLKDAEPVSDWLAVSVDNFGAKTTNPLPGLFSIGDAAAFIDPFTGSGMLMALESAEILAEALSAHRFSPAKAAALYEKSYAGKFQKRLRVSGWLRRAAFVPNLAGYVISALNFSQKSRQILARATRPSRPAGKIKS